MRESPRIDYWSMRWDKSAATFDEETGFMRVSGVATQVGLLEYGEVDGAPHDGYFEYVGPDVVSDEKSIATLRGLPITNDHPENMLDVSNTARHQVGSISDVRVEGSGDATILRIDALFTDQGAIDAYRSGKKQLSPGYYSQIDETPGKFHGKGFNAKQGVRNYNHMALVPQARAGPSNRLDSRRTAWGRTFRTDGLRIQSRGEYMLERTKKDEEASGSKGKSDEVVTISIDGEEVEVDQRIKDQYDRMAEKLQSLQTTDVEGEEEEEEEEEEGEKEELEDKTDEEDDKKNGKKDMSRVTQKQFRDGLDSVADAVMDRMEKRDARIAKVATARQDTIHAAEKVLPNSYRFDGQTNAQIQRAAIKAFNPALVPLAKKDSDLPGIFAVATAGTARKDEPISGLRDKGRVDRNNETKIDKSYRRVQCRKDAMRKAPAGAKAVEAGRLALVEFDRGEVA